MDYGPRWRRASRRYAARWLILGGEIKLGNAELLWKLFCAMVASNATLVSLVFGAAKLA